MAQKLARPVHVAGRWWGPDDEVPAEVAAKITNPKAWTDADLRPDGTPVRKRDAGYDGHQLVGYVHVDGRRYGPDDPVPEEDARRITNPKVWANGDVPQFEDADELGWSAATDDAGAVPPRRSTVPPPPRVGRGSGTDAWASYARANDVDVPDGASRDEIIAACEDAGVLDES